MINITVLLLVVILVIAIYVFTKNYEFLSETGKMDLPFVPAAGGIAPLLSIIATDKITAPSSVSVKKTTKVPLKTPTPTPIPIPIPNTIIKAKK